MAAWDEGEYVAGEPGPAWKPPTSNASARVWSTSPWRLLLCVWCGLGHAGCCCWNDCGMIAGEPSGEKKSPGAMPFRPGWFGRHDCAEGGSEDATDENVEWGVSAGDMSGENMNCPGHHAEISGVDRKSVV